MKRRKEDSARDRVRPAGAGDIDAVLEVLGGYFAKSLVPKDGAIIDGDFGDTITLCNDVTELDWGRSFVVEHKGGIVGFCNWRPVGQKVAKTTLITVLPEHRQHGYGRQLQVARMRQAIEKGMETLFTYCEGPEAVAWYKKNFGYVEIKEVPLAHRLYFIRKEDGSVVWFVHYGSKEKLQKELICDLNRWKDDSDAGYY